MRKKQARFVSMILALALVLNVVLAVPFTVEAEDDGIVKGSIEYPGGKVVDGTGIWNSAGGGQYLLEGDFDVTFSFTNDPFDVATNWGNNFVFEFMPATDTAGVTLRADRYGWLFESENVSNVPFYLGTVTWDWANYVEMCQTNTFVTLNIKKMSDNVISAVAEFKSAEEGTPAGTVTYAIVYPKGIPNSLVVQLGANFSKITIWKCIYNTCTSTKTTKEYADKTITGYLTDFASNDTLSGDFRAVYSFKNQSNGTANWENFIFEISGSGLSTIARADAFDDAGTLTGCWTSDYNWDTLVADMGAGANVTAIIERIGNDLNLFYIIEGNSYTYFATAGKSFDILPDELTVKLSGNNVSLSDIEATIYKLTYAGDEEDDDIRYGSVTDNVSVHDPSIIKNEKTGYYYVFGSHMAWARSTDLIHWQTFYNNINTDYATIFAKEAAWSAHGSSNYDVSGNLWAPDVIWNDTMKKWCMYMSVNGDNFYSSIVLLTADNIEGPYTYVGPVVYSGFTTDTAAETDFAKVMGTNTVDERYTRYRNSTNNRTYGMNAIDPCVTYDGNGDLWMSYGSWFGGIYMIKLDKTNGLRDYTNTYTLNEGVSDPYQGIKIAGGDHSSGEASYLEKIGSYWYLFMSYGALEANGGYNMRVFRSENITGPYVDMSGDKANYAAYYDNINGTVGNRLMSYYKWSYMDKGQTAQGHNSAFTDSDGKSYVVYHTRFDDGTEGHQVRVHQLFVNQAGWLVAAPFEYAGESLTAINTADVAGKYEVLFHESPSYADVECVTGQTVTFAKDGTLSGAIEGTWALDGYYATLTAEDGTVYKGVFVNQKMEEQDETVLCFTLIGSDEISVWGYKYPYSDANLVEMAADQIKLPIGTFGQNITLPSVGLYDAEITWRSEKSTVIADDGTVTLPAQDTVVNLIATVTIEDETATRKYPVKVFSDKKNETEKYLIWEYFTDEEKDLNDAAEGSIRYPNPFNGNNVLGISIYNGVSIEFDVATDVSGQFLNYILSLNDGVSAGLWFSGGSYLGYNQDGVIYFDANVKNTLPWAAGTDFIGDSATIRIDMYPDRFEVYANDELAYTQDDIGSSKIPGSKNINSYASVLSYLRNTATYLNFGWGTFDWLAYDGTISNVKLYAQPIDYVDTSGYVYYEDYNSTGDTGWISPNAQNELSIKNDGDAHSGYVNFAATGSNGRGAYTNFPSEANLKDWYIVEADINMTPGNDQANAQFAITGTDAAYDSNNYNNGIISGYILKLSNKAANSNVYYINDGTQTVTIPKDTWVHIKAVVTGGTDVLAEITINGETKTYSTEVNGNGVLKGLYVLKSRYYGEVSIDNIAVTQLHYGKPSFTWSADGKTASALFPCEENEDYSVTLKAEVTDTVKTEPTCEGKGTTAYTATVEFNGETYTDTKNVEDIPAKGHTPADPAEENLKEATCTEKGSYDEVVYCTECDKELSRISKSIDALGHLRPELPTIETENEDASCGEVTTYCEVYYCSRCGEELERSETKSEPLPHNPGEAVIENRKEATCTKDGSHDEVIYCTRCDEEISRKTVVDEKLGHNPGDTVIEEGKAATCTEDGFHYEVVYCKRCDEEIEREKIIDEKLGHTPGNTVVEKEVAATCSAEGSYDEVVYCTVCGEELSRTAKTVAKIAHTPGEAKIENEKKPTCDAEGSYDEVVYCTVCGEELSRTVKAVDKVPHTPGEVKIENEKAPTCKADGSYDEVIYCTVCGDEISRTAKTVAKLAHTPGDTEIENEKKPTCSADGYYDEVVYCTVCGEELSRTAKTVAKLTHIPGEPKLENEKKPTCDTDGSYDEAVYCTLCGEELSRTTTTVPATGHSDGDKDGKCDLCGQCLHQHDSDGNCIEDDCKHGNDCCPKITEEPEEPDEPKEPDKPEEPSGNGSVEQNVQTGEGTPDTVIKMNEEELKESVLNEEEKEAVENGAHVEIVLSVEVRETVEPDNAAKVEEAVGSSYIVGMYLELDLNIYIDNELSRAVTVTDEPIYITVDIPEELYAYGREYVIVREHDGKVDILKDLDSDPRTITFETDRFSTYAIAYTADVAEAPSEPTEPDGTDDKAPNTGYGADMAVRVTIMFIAAAAMFGTLYIKRRAM